MAIVLEKKFQELRDIVINADKFIWNGGREYTGTVNPRGIMSMHNSGLNITQNSLILAENVPSKYLHDDEYPFGVVFADLDENFDLVEWDPSSKTLGAIAADLCPNGTAESLVDEYQSGRITYNIMFKL
jgi:hypothetical protein